ncbi:putative F420-0 ABC transporter substrate-binding protein [Arthrobacter sp. I2-34]|uniref:F420-0 ABC transporter substrate-binding protein n=1 Tax=Arthrobacter hankyongi TaxID=2904801 RepID=A0ABS9L3J8_9MICC|nr:putative F420-0 ABC transporter substrate-binding protein [Arthrobacter hankyongi]MCG2621074.1 putative F420-0 ABC transporter substrate-binding protein [Arthrobacter hankyongi]
MSAARYFAPTLTLCAALLLTGCASATQGPAAAAPSAAAQNTAGQPVTVDNCGTKVSFAKAPERVVTIKSTTTEMLLALGLGDRIEGSAASDGPLPEEFAADAPPILAEQLPSQEAVLETAPDLVYAGWESNFSTEGAGKRESLQKLGINTYVSPAACKAPGYKPDPMTFDKLFGEIQEVGRIFHAEEAAQDLVKSQQEALAAIKPSTKELTALWYSSGAADSPYVGAGIGAPQMIMEAAGLKNIAAEVKDTWTPYSWEVVAEQNPDVIVLIDSSWSTAKKKISVLESNPVTAKLDAVREGRYLVLPFPASEAGVRNVAAAASLVDQLKTMNVAD